MNPLYLQFVFAMLLVVNGILCDIGMSKKPGRGGRTCTVEDDDDDDDDNGGGLPNQAARDSPCEVTTATTAGPGEWRIDLSCPTSSDSYDIVLVTFDYCTKGPPRDDTLMFNCSESGGQPVNVVNVGPPFFLMYASCSRPPSTLRVELTASKMFKIDDIRIDFAELRTVESCNPADPMTTVTTTGQSQSTTANPTTTVTTITPPQPTSVISITRALTSNKTSQPTFGKSSTASIVVPPVVVLVAVFLLVALVASIWRKRRNKQTSALNIRSTVNQNEDTVVYNEIGEQDYNTLFGGKEKDDYHEYNVQDRPQGNTSVDRTTASGSGPYQELLKDGTRAVAAVNMSPEVTGPRHGVADDLHAYQDLRQDDRSVSGSHPNGEMPNQLPSKDTPATENGYQALKTATPEYATLEPSPEYSTLEQNDQSMTGTSDVSEPPSDKQYDMLQRSLNTVGQPPSAGYGTLKPMNETDADYESPDGQPKATSDV